MKSEQRKLEAAPIIWSEDGELKTGPAGFRLGAVAAAPDILKTAGADAIREGLARHGVGDWGDRTPEAAQRNDEAAGPAGGWSRSTRSPPACCGS